jgi:hypothetical protein
MSYDKSYPYVHVEWIEHYKLNEKFKKDEIEKSKVEWIKVYDNSNNFIGYLKIVDGIGIHIKKWLGGWDELMVKEIMDSLSKPIDISEMRNILYEIERWFDIELEFKGDGRISTLYNSLTWFHGQEYINMMLKPYNIELVRDYDGITRVEFITERPYTYEKVSKAIKYITRGLRIYLLVKKVQESEAIKIIIDLINTFY